MTYTTVYTTGGARIEIGYDISQDVANNRSTVNATAYVTRIDGSYYSYRTAPVTFALNIAGNSKTYGWSFNMSNMVVGTRYAITSHSVTINHNADGTASAVSMSVYCVTGTSGLGTINGSTTISLTRIARATEVSVNYSIRDMGTVIRITLIDGVSTFKHRLHFAFLGINYSFFQELSAGVTFYDWTIPVDTLVKKLPNAESGTVTIISETWSGSTYIGNKECTFTAKVPSTFVPTVTFAKSGVGLYLSQYVQAKSRVSVTLTDSGVLESTIVNRSTTVKSGANLISSSTSDIFTSATINYSGVIDIHTTVTDSRGRSATASDTINVVAYAPPKMLTFTSIRADANGDANPQGAFIKMTGSSVVSTIGNTNTPTTSLNYRLSGASTWTTAISETILYTPTLEIIIAADVNSSFETNITVTDYYSSANTSMDIGTAFVLIDFHSSGTSLAFGKVASGEALFEVGGDIRLDGTINARFNATQIVDADDLDTLTTLGMYYCSSNIIVATLLHCPTTLAFSLLVEKHAGIKQTLSVYLTTDVSVYVRNLYNGVWGAWYNTIMPNGSSPNGVIESGTNANGSYVKYGNGTMIAYHSLATITTDTVTWTFPVPFHTAPNVVGNAIGTVTTLMSLQVWNVFSSTTRIQVINSANARIVANTMLTATGRWKA